MLQCAKLIEASDLFYNSQLKHLKVVKKTEGEPYPDRINQITRVDIAEISHVVMLKNPVLTVVKGNYIVNS